jgi:uncharacterized protein (DUF58 family)
MQRTFGLFIKQKSIVIHQPIEVFPNAFHARWNELSTNRSKELDMGVARLKNIGIGTEFESLRPYQQGDSLASIDWKATAKNSTLISRSYEDEKQQNIIVVIDTGRATAGECKGSSRLDYFINAALMLAYTSLRQGDKFGVIAFHQKVDTYLPPVRGIHELETVSSYLYDIKSNLVESDYSAVCNFLNLKFRKRSLICVMTDILDENANFELLQYMKNFARYHLPMVITLRDESLDDLVNEPIQQSNDVFTKTAAVMLNQERAKALQWMRRQGVDVLDVYPQQLTTELIRRYIDLKNRHRI